MNREETMEKIDKKMDQGELQLDLANKLQSLYKQEYKLESASRSLIKKKTKELHSLIDQKGSMVVSWANIRKIISNIENLKNGIATPLVPYWKWQDWASAIRNHFHDDCDSFDRGLRVKMMVLITKTLESALKLSKKHAERHQEMHEKMLEARRKKWKKESEEHEKNKEDKK